MKTRQFILVALLAALAAALSNIALQKDQLWLFVGALVAVFAGGGVLLHRRSNEILDELAILREHLETTRQQAGLLARLTRETRDAVEAMQAEGAAAPGNAARSGDFAVLSALVRDIADSVAELDRRSEQTEAGLQALGRAGAVQSAAVAQPTPPAYVAPVAPPPASVVPALQPAFEPPVAEPARTAPESQTRQAPLRGLPPTAEISRPAEPSRAVRQLVAAAIAADRFDLFLQRVVSLPQRRVRGYEVTLRPDGSDVLIPNAEIRQAVEAVGHQLAFDRKLMIQTIRLARVFERRERDVLLFADVSHRFLMSEDAFDDITALVADAPLAPQRIVLALPQRFFAKAVATEHEALRRLSELGFRFLLRDVEAFEFDLSRLSRIGVRWIRASAASFLETVEAKDQIMEVSAADFVALLDRRKIAFVAENVGEEGTVAELLDLGVAYAEGAVFSPPQAVRADVLEGEMGTRPAAASRPSEPAPERRSLRDIARRA